MSARQEPKSEVWVYVLEVTFFGEYGWTSVHRTDTGAYQRLADKVKEYDTDGSLWEAYGRALSGANGPSAAGEEGDPIVWGISHLPVEQ
ncbi:hypothetical protein BN970_01394 [Mycolicibacterium conceptionense]|uniref:Uncharacterized protein n=1 Tax=Mycolicibacterium conceptionense TaxID=451644 RepID=A0A0U1D572_9MYCO|nr:hypothetical protein [Mycolicibacterium conceptionense]ORV20982.1 hypothetical protein AWB98_01410 [Mycolicibacterium conceptionense]CQD07388.1 hypothetical protein BN970_01394 [Mycolicibacterium conceptionense]